MSHLTGELKTEWSRSSSACWGSFTVTVENIGQKKITVARAVYEVSNATPARLGSNKELKIIGTLPVSAQQVAEGEFVPSILVREFVPKAGGHQTLNFLLHPEDEKEYWFKAELFDGSNQSLAYWVGVIEACQEDKATKETK